MQDAIFPFKPKPQKLLSLRALRTQGVAIPPFKLKPLILGLLKHLGDYYSLTSSNFVMTALNKVFRQPERKRHCER